MVNPTPGPEQYPPQGQPDWNAPQNPQGYGGQPQPGYGGAPQPGFGGGYPAGAPGQRPGLVTAAAITAIVWGSLGALFGLIGLAFAFALSAILGLVFLIALVLSVALIVGGIFVLTGKPPKLLLMTAYVAIAVNVVSLIVAVAQGGSAFSGVLGFILPGVIVFLLMQPQSKQYFAARGQGY